MQELGQVSVYIESSSRVHGEGQLKLRPGHSNCDFGWRRAFRRPIPKLKQTESVIRLMCNGGRRDT